MAKILIVDDEHSVQFLYEKVFKKEISENQFEILFSRSGEDAIEILKSDDEIALLISDINMPGLSGFELLQEVKTFRPNLPIYMSSAYNDGERQSLAKELGAADYIVKPVDFNALKQKINDILNN
jgi:DNA-binding NtrC family response regulator